MKNEPKRRPGDYLLDHYLPDADHDTRERARAAFSEFAVLLLRIGERLYRIQIAEDSPELSNGAILWEAHDEPPT